MRRASTIALTALLFLGSDALAQDHQHHGMPGMAPAQNPRQATPSAPSTPAGQSTEPEHSMQDMQMEMHSPGDVTSNVTAVQEPENPARKTGSELPVPDLLKDAAKVSARTLQQFEEAAEKNSPWLKQAAAMVRASAGTAQQAGLWPNPVVGYEGSEIRGGSFHGGEQGGFVEQDFILGGKLRLRRNAANEQRKAAELSAEEARITIRAAVQSRFYAALAQLRAVEVRQASLDLAIDAATTAHQLANVGQADAPDVLQAEIEAERAKLEFSRAQRDYIAAYRQLAVAAAEPQLPLALLEGDLEALPEIKPESYLEQLLANSPTLKRARQQSTQAEAQLASQKREAIPNLALRLGAQSNRELNESSLRAVGAQGFAAASVQLPIFNRNQGNIAASAAQLEIQKQEVERLRLELTDAAQPALQRYEVAKLEAERYRTQLLPRAQRAYELYLQKYRNMAAAYPEVIQSQRTLFELQQSYVHALAEGWSSALALQNYLLVTGAGMPPARAGVSANPPNTMAGTE